MGALMWEACAFPEAPPLLPEALAGACYALWEPPLVHYEYPPYLLCLTPHYKGCIRG